MRATTIHVPLVNNTFRVRLNPSCERPFQQTSPDDRSNIKEEAPGADPPPSSSVLSHRRAQPRFPQPQLHRHQTPPSRMWATPTQVRWKPTPIWSKLVNTPEHRHDPACYALPNSPLALSASQLRVVPVGQVCDKAGICLRQHKCFSFMGPGS